MEENFTCLISLTHIFAGNTFLILHKNFPSHIIEISKCYGIKIHYAGTYTFTLLDPCNFHNVEDKITWILLN